MAGQAEALPTGTGREWQPARAKELIQERLGIPGACLPILLALQTEFGCVPDEAIPLVADALLLSRAEVVGVRDFYHDFRREPGGRHLLRICRAESCQSMGCEALVQQIEARLGIRMGDTTPDGAITLKTVYCLGNCALSPAILLDGDLYGRVFAESVDPLVTRSEGGKREAGGGRLEASPASSMHPLTQPPSHPLTRSPAHPVTQSPTHPLTPRVFVPRDAAALSVGAEAVAAAIRREAAVRGIDLTLVRNGSRGLFWLEPLVEVEVEGQRIAYGPVSPEQVPSLFDAGFLFSSTGARCGLCLGPTEEIPYLRQQERLTFARCGVIDPLSISDYRDHGGFRGLERALAIEPAAIVEEVTASGLRGRGGAGFPTGIKWRTVLQQQSDRKYIVCNADEGDSGTFADRMLMEGDPFSLIEGMIIAGLAVGADTGFVYIRSEYPHAFSTFHQAVALARHHGYLGPSSAGRGKSFGIEVRLGAGAYICGEETSLLESLEGKKGVIRAKPPLPAISGLFGKPTVVNNVLSLATVPTILDRGAAFYAEFGMGRSRGTMPFQLAGNVRRGGLIEKAFGLTLREAIFDFGGGTASGRPFRAVQVGGPLGAYFPESLLDTPLDYEAFAAKKGLLGHGGMVVFDDTVDLASQARFAMQFCAEESCGKCTPCRIGSTRGVEVIDRIIANHDRRKNLELLDDLCEVMTDASLCALGGLTPYPVLSAVRHFPEDFGGNGEGRGA